MTENNFPGRKSFFGQPFRKGLLLLCAVLLSAGYAAAQVFGGNPPSVKWRQINTDTLRVIFPEGLETQARRVAGTATYLNAQVRRSIGDRQRKLDIVLQPRVSYSNGYVALSPFRSEFEGGPAQDPFTLGTLNWMQQLSLHEYRHALQNMNFRAGVGRTLGIVFGDNGQAASTSALIPGWFWEGEAVFMETALSSQGRGRQPAFFDEFRGMYLENKDYPYAKVFNGSYKDRLPDNRYQLGYLMISYGRQQYGMHFWEKIAHEGLLDSRYIHGQEGRKGFKWLHYDIFPLAASLKENTGHKIPGFYRQSFRYYGDRWEQQRKNTSETSTSALPVPRRRAVTDYLYPYPMPDGRVLALRRGFDRTAAIVAVDSAGHTEVLVRPGLPDDTYFSFRGNKIVWSETRPDVRWGWRSYSVIRIFDLSARRTHTLTHRSRLFAPDISADGKHIVALEVGDTLHYALVVLDAATGTSQKRLPNPEGFYYSYPKFSADGTHVYASARDREGKTGLVSVDLQTGRLQRLTPFSWHVTGMPVPAGDYVLYPAAYGAVVNLYAVRLRDHRIFRVTERLRDSYGAAADTAEQRILFSEFQLEGSRLLQTDWNPAAWAPFDTARLAGVQNPYVDEALGQEGGDISAKIPARDFAVTRYKKGQHLFRVHSWSPLPEFPETGIFLQSGNTLNTLQMNAGGGYNFNDKNPFARFQVQYGGWYPMLNATVEEQFHRYEYTSQHRKVVWNETDISGGFTLPFNFSTGRYLRYLSLGANLHADYVRFLPDQHLQGSNYTFTYLAPALQFTNTRFTAPQQFNPRFGQTLLLTYRHSMGGLYATQLTAAATLFFPGLFPTHSLYFDLGYGRRDRREEYLYTDDFIYAAGYEKAPYRQIWRAGVNYQLPLLYPDVGFSWLYLKRVRAQGFFDYSRARLSARAGGDNRMFRSVGGTLYLDVQLFGVLQLPLGIRYSYLLDPDWFYPDRSGRWQLTVPLQF
ncbi:hypothetical protein [Compostibacter hankyongensis]